jgi:hypothetical protein
VKGGGKRLDRDANKGVGCFCLLAHARAIVRSIGGLLSTRLLLAPVSFV